MLTEYFENSGYYTENDSDWILKARSRLDNIKLMCHTQVKLDNFFKND